MKRDFKDSGKNDSGTNRPEASRAEGREENFTRQQLRDYQQHHREQQDRQFYEQRMKESRQEQEENEPIRQGFESLFTSTRDAGHGLSGTRDASRGTRDAGRGLSGDRQLELNNQLYKERIDASKTTPAEEETRLGFESLFTNIQANEGSRVQWLEDIHPEPVGLNRTESTRNRQEIARLPGFHGSLSEIGEETSPEQPGTVPPESPTNRLPRRSRPTIRIDAGSVYAPQREIPNPPEQSDMVPPESPTTRPNAGDISPLSRGPSIRAPFHDVSPPDSPRSGSPTGDSSALHASRLREALLRETGRQQQQPPKQFRIPRKPVGGREGN